MSRKTWQYLHIGLMVGIAMCAAKLLEAYFTNSPDSTNGTLIAGLFASAYIPVRLAFDWHYGFFKPETGLPSRIQEGEKR